MSSVKFVPASGICESGLLVCGEAPGKQEDKEGRPFVGRAGQLLDKMLDYIELNRENVYVTNVCKIRPTSLKNIEGPLKVWEGVDILQNRTPTDEELESWKPLLIKELKEVKPKVILALGACASKTLLGWQKFTNMTTTRGQVFTLKNGMKVVCSWHPAYLLRKPNHKKTNKQVKDDLKLVRKLLNE